MSTMSKRLWLQRAGAISFCFFMVKGLFWLAAALVFYCTL